MAMTDPDARPPGPLARVGQSDSFAGFTRLSIVFVGAVIGWASFDFRSALSRIDENQKAIIAIGDRTTHVEDAAANAREAAAAALNSGREFRIWTEGRVNDLTSLINATGRQIDTVDRKESIVEGRVHCLENKGRCPP